MEGDRRKSGSGSRQDGGSKRRNNSNNNSRRDSGGHQHGRGGQGGRGGGGAFFEEHLELTKVEVGVEQGKFLVGMLRINKKKRSEAYVTVPGFPIDILFDGEKARNRGLDGDIVAFSVSDDLRNWHIDEKAQVKELLLLHQSATTTNADSTITIIPAADNSNIPTCAADNTYSLQGPSAASLSQKLWQPALHIGGAGGAITTGTLGTDEDEQDRLSASSTLHGLPAAIVTAMNTSLHYKTKIQRILTAYQENHHHRDGEPPLRPTGVVVSILQRVHPRRAIGVLRGADASAPLQPIPDKHSQINVYPIDTRIPFVIVPRTDVPAEHRGFFANPSDYNTTLFAVSLDSWPASSRFPSGHILGGVGEAGEIPTEQKVFLDECEIDDSPFSDDVMNCLDEYEAQCETIMVPTTKLPSTKLPSVGTTTNGAGAGAGAISAAITTATSMSDVKGMKIWRIPASELAVRKDLRQERIFTVDPTTAKDLDDAMHIRRLEDDSTMTTTSTSGNDRGGAGEGVAHDAENASAKEIYEVGVHIADVSYFVRPGTALDTEARSRCTSTYLVSRVIPMLPPLLCEELCSINPGVDRLAFSIIWKMRGNGELLPEQPWIGRSIIRSVSKLDYATAQRMVDDEISKEMVEKAELDESAIPSSLWEPLRRPGAAAAAVDAAAIASSSSSSSDAGASAGAGAIPVAATSSSSPMSNTPHTCLEVWEDIRTMHRVAMARRRKRFAAGALSLTKAKLIFNVDADGNPVGVSTYPLKDSNRVVEEFMLLANYFAAQAIALGVGNRAVLRRHPSLDPERALGVISVAKALGYALDLSSAGALHNSLLRIASTDKDAARAVEYLATKPMQPALYFTSAELPTKDWGHYALAIPYYTHFTSPIRRYADVMVHRLLAEVTTSTTPTITGVSTVSNTALTATTTTNNNIKSKANIATSSELAYLISQCNQCNTRKKNAKLAQERCDRVYLTLYVRDAMKKNNNNNSSCNNNTAISTVPPTVRSTTGGISVECMVVDIGGGGGGGSGSTNDRFTVLIREWDVERIVFMDRCGWSAKWMEKERVLRVQNEGSTPHGTEDEESSHTEDDENEIGAGGGGGSGEGKNQGRDGRNHHNRNNNNNKSRGPSQSTIKIAPGSCLDISLLTVFRAEAIAITDRLPIDIDIVLQEVMRK